MKQKIINILSFLTFVFYIGLLFNVVFFSRSFYRGVNLIPFETINNYGLLSYSNIMNIVMFIPVGIYSMLFTSKKHNKVLKSLLIVICSTIFIETTQYVFSRGAFDIDDIILNSLGGIIGIVIYMLIDLFAKKDASKTNNIVKVLSFIVGVPIIAIDFLLYLSN